MLYLFLMYHIGDVGGRQIYAFIYPRSGFSHLDKDSEGVATITSFTYCLCSISFSLFLLLQLQILKQLYLLRFENMLKIFFSLYPQFCLISHKSLYSQTNLFQ